MKKTLYGILPAVAAAFICGTAFAQLSVTPALPDKNWTHCMWLPRFDAKKALAGSNSYDVVFLGDSITHGWEGRGAKVWEKNFADGEYKALNCGISGDRTEHVLWRLYNGQLAELSPKAFVIMIGTNNNSSKDTKPENVASAIEQLVAKIRAKQPKAKIVLHPIFPRGNSAQESGNRAHLRGERSTSL